jgi:hypothetical protein
VVSSGFVGAEAGAAKPATGMTATTGMDNS